MKTVLLIEPGTDVKYPPVGLLHLASAIRDKYKVVIKDYSSRQIDKNEIVNLIKKENPLAVGLRVLTGPCIPRAIIISKIAKQFDIPVIWGGPHPTILPKQTLENDFIDAICIGEGENTLNDLLDYFQGKKKKILGAGIKQNNKIIIYHPQTKFVDFNKLKMPAWDLLEDIDRYFPNKKHNALPISTTRGCVFKCGFCHNSNKNVNCYLGKYRIAPPERAFEELKFVQSLTKNKIDFLNVGEDLHLISYDYAKQFCKAFEKYGVKNLKWSTSARYSILDEKIISMIAKHNCKSILLGIESGSERIQKINGKVVKLEHAIKMSKLLRKKGIFVTNSYIFGHPTETTNELKKTLKYLKKIPADENLIQLYRPMPETPYFKLCVDNNKITNIPKRLEDWAGFGVLGHDTNVSNIPDKILFSTFYKTNAIQQTKYLINQQIHYLKNGNIIAFLKNFINNRFTHKLKEYLIAKKKLI